MRALVTGGYARKCLAVVTSLGRRGVAVDAGNADRWGPPLWSRWAADRFVYPDPAADEEAFLKALEARLASHPADLVFPTGGADTAALARARDRFAVPIAAPPIGKIELANDKARLLAAAEAAGVPIPKTYFDPSPSSVRDFPVLVRPNRGSGGRGLIRVDRAAALAGAIERTRAAHGSVLVQEYVPTTTGGFGCSSVMDPGSRPLALFCHRRLREYPVTGGPATLVESVHEPVLAAQAERLLRALSWTSVAMTEWRLDARDGVFKLIEINPRMWGSSHLALDAGVDFPWLLWCLHLGLPVEPATVYRAGVRRRWLVPADMLHWWRNPERRRIDPPFWRIFERATRYDFLDPRDPLPSLMNIAYLARLVVTGGARRYVDRS
jgi:predicted ATP-grasp superfamily ATP-dependent carboligase